MSFARRLGTLYAGRRRQLPGGTLPGEPYASAAALEVRLAGRTVLSGRQR